MKQSKHHTAGAVLTLLLAAPLVTEILPGSTRFSSLFVFPIEICVWGGGAVLIRYLVRSRQLNWKGMLLLALALSVAEEFLIQQTSIAPLVIRLKGVTYARAWDINYVYLLWALLYESVFVVLLPVHLAEFLFPGKKRDPWIGRRGVMLYSVLFLAGSFFAWFTWTQIARPKVFHMPAYHAPLRLVLPALAAIAVLVTSALVFCRQRPIAENAAKPPVFWLTGILGGLWTVPLYGLVILAFGLHPDFPPLWAVLGALVLAAIAFGTVPRWSASAAWRDRERYALICGVLLGSMLVSFVGFIGAAPADLWFKVAVDVVACVLLMRWSGKLRKKTNESDGPMTEA